MKYLIINCIIRHLGMKQVFTQRIMEMQVKHFLNCDDFWVLTEYLCWGLRFFLLFCSLLEFLSHLLLKDNNDQYLREIKDVAKREGE